MYFGEALASHFAYPQLRKSELAAGPISFAGVGSVVSVLGFDRRDHAVGAVPALAVPRVHPADGAYSTSARLGVPPFSRTCTASCGPRPERGTPPPGHPPAKGPPGARGAPTGAVWSWDITTLRGPARGQYFQLYVILDIFSRYVVGWTVAAREDSDIAEALIEQAAATHGAPGAVHADRDTSMTSKPVAQLLMDLGVARSHSRPHVSNDNRLFTIEGVVGV